MKDYIGHIFIFLLLTTSFCFSGQAQTDPSHKKTNRLNFSFAAGTQFHALLRDKYFPLDTSIILEREQIAENYYDRGGRVGRRYVSTFGFHSALFCNYSLKRINFETGLQLYFRQRRFIMDEDTIERNIVNIFNFNNERPLDTFKTVNYSHFNIVFPLYCGYTIKRFTGLIGAKISTFTTTHEQLMSLNNHLTNHYITHGRLYLEMFPCVKFRYLLSNRKTNVSTYFEIDKRVWKYYDFLFGFEIKLKK